jgi:hypothetical protein
MNPHLPRRRWTIPAAAAALGLTGGLVLGGLGIANAASSTGSTSPSTSPSVVAPYGGSGSSSGAPWPGGARALPMSGTVTAVTANSVTIKTSSATTTFAVTSASDIDKNGEAALSDLSVGDAVTLSTTTSGSTVAIDKLHAGNDSLDWPSGPPAGASGAPSQAPYGAPPAGSPAA